jgi:hypothetical protein
LSNMGWSVRWLSGSHRKGDAMRTAIVVLFLVVMSVLISILALGPAGKVASVVAAPLSCIPMEEKLVCDDGTHATTVFCDELAEDVVLCHGA